MHAASITPFRFGCALAGAILATSNLSAAVHLPGDLRIDNVDFERHVMGVLGKMGCNSGSCHGSFQGKGGFRLSLFGYDPDKDYFALTRESLGRRIDPVNPERSLFLLKPTGQVDHGGGMRFGRDSWEYRLLQEWIAGGARRLKGNGEIAEITISPPELAFTKPGETGQLSVQARFANGAREDITPLCDFRVNDDAIAEVTALGRVSTLRGGDTAVVVSYRGQLLPVRVLVPVAASPGFRYPQVPEANYIDHEVFAKLKRLNIVPSGLADDAEFLRRVTIDTIGSLPEPEEVRRFLANPDPNKRGKKIDELLDHPLHAALWATKFCDITGNNTDALENPPQLKPKRSQMWHDWFRKRLAENMPYDQIVRGVLCATSRDGLSPEQWLKQVREIDETAQKAFDTKYAERPSLDLFWRRAQQVPIEQWGEKTAAAFLGVRLECAQCHKHPFDRWTQADYRSYANIFGQLAFGLSPEAKKLVDEENAARAVVREVFIGGKGQTLRDPDTNRPLPAKALGGPVINATKGQDARLPLFDWLRSPDNPYFARCFVNRVWGHYFGVGIVDPVDNFSLANPPSNEKLLDALARDFIAHNYSIRDIERTILNSRTYQLSSHTNETNRLDHSNYSHSFIRPMMAEVVVDVLNSALGAAEPFGGKLGGDARPGAHAIEIGSSRVQNQTLMYAFRIFGRPPRTSACDCERSLEPALPQRLFLMTDPNVLAKLQAPAGRLQQLLKTNQSDTEVLEEMFLATLTRFPTEAEKKLFLEYRATLTPKAPPTEVVKTKSNAPKKGKPAAAVANLQSRRLQAFTDAVWALINTREFVLNH